MSPVTVDDTRVLNAHNAALYRKVSVRVAAPLVLLYIIAFLDRVNVSFAALSMNRDLGISKQQFGFAAGIFFIGYMLFAVPSNVALKRFGPRRWLAFLMVTWGIFSASLAFVHGPKAYVALRFLLGAAEAGFFPGIVYYLTRWLPSTARGGILSLFTLSIPLSSIIGSPVSAKILRLGGAGGLAGWQWLFLLEAFPAILCGACIPWMLTASPAEARWLNADEKQRLATAIDQDDTRAAQAVAAAASSRLPHGLIAFASLTYFLYAVGLYALGFWVPQLLAAHGVGLVWLGWLTAVPSAAGAVSMLIWSYAADKTGHHLRHFAASMSVGAAGFVFSAFATETAIVVLGLALAATGVFASLPLWWAGFTQRVNVWHAAIAIAIVNSIGNLGGFAGPPAIGWLTERTHSYAAALLATAACCALGAVLGLSLSTSRRTRP